ncbi:hypothetical protein [Tengunoibacter tsumagoiensis]|uniref:Glycosyltransferase 2-like domain-containing protein n=1 Tax=Tengunoibacter tsumagoiensis TaxID=2014871 RepID=A0A401ZUK0_9CHLR|nr:hypothetical protein [Tengunoibacter tsumagoiensis]GCE10472.1 hypothetical protein KTT_03310 [Tengunoibacter tsumagoiensis]
MAHTSLLFFAFPGLALKRKAKQPTLLEAITSKTTDAFMPSSGIIQSPKLSVILSTQQNSYELQSVIQQIRQNLYTLIDELEILVVRSAPDLPSHQPGTEPSPTRSDATGQPYVRWYNNLYAAINQAQMDLILLMNADEAFQIADIQAFLSLTEHYDLVLGYRDKHQISSLQRMGTWLWRQLVWFIFGLQVRDINCTFKLYHRDCLNNISLEGGDNLLHTEMLYKCLRKGYTYTEVALTAPSLQSIGSQSIRPASLSRRSRSPLKKCYELLLYAQRWHMEELSEMK